MRNFGGRLLMDMQQLVRRLPGAVSTRVGYTGRNEVDRLPSRLLPTVGTLRPLPGTDAVEPQEGTQGRQAAFFWRSRRPRRPQSIRCVPEAVGHGRLGRLRQGTFWWATGHTAIFVALHASSRNLEPPPDRSRREWRELALQKLPH